MGTSASSKGPGSGIPLIPPWVTPVETLPNPIEEDPSPSTNKGPVPTDVENRPAEEDSEPTPTNQPEVDRNAQPRRFAATRRSLGQFATSGNRGDLQRALGHYARSGLGGASSGGARFGNSARIGGSFYNVLDGLRVADGRPGGVGLDRQALLLLPANEVAERIVEAIAPTDGSQDREANREALAHAMSSLLAQDPNVNLLELNAEQIDILVTGFLAEDLWRRIDLDVGQALFEKVDAATAISRSEEMRRFVLQTMNASFRQRINDGQALNRSDASVLCASIYKDTLAVFADYIQ
ncbi:MAG: Qat anti-phage system associated protein QatB [Verrucomicrobiota bacterium]